MVEYSRRQGRTHFDSYGGRCFHYDFIISTYLVSYIRYIEAFHAWQIFAIMYIIKNNGLYEYYILEVLIYTFYF